MTSAGLFLGATRQTIAQTSLVPFLPDRRSARDLLGVRAQDLNQYQWGVASKSGRSPSEGCGSA